MNLSVDHSAPPADEGAERAVLGALLTQMDCVDKLDGVVDAGDFYAPRHRLIYAEARELTDENKVVDAVTVGRRLRDKNRLADAGGADYLAELSQLSAAPENVAVYAGIVRNTAILRRLLSAVSAISDLAHLPRGRDPGAILNEAQELIMKIGEARGGEMRQLRDTAGDYAARLFRMVDRPDKGAITGLPSGFADLDQKTAGFQPGDLIIVAGRPGMGKTALALNIARAAAERGPAVGIFSMEMSNDQLLARLLSAQAQVDQQKMRIADLSDEEVSRISHAITPIEKMPIYVDDSGMLNVTELRGRARRLRRTLRAAGGELGMVIVDYLQLMEGAPHEQRENRNLELSAISRHLKATAKELNVPVIALSQLNRGLESRANKRPVLSDLRDSGSIEQDADLVLFIHREEMYSPETPEKGIAEIIIGKQRNGPTGMVKLSFLDRLTSFGDAPQEERF